MLAQLDKHKALDMLQEKHQRSLVRKQKLVEEEKACAHDWIADLKSGFKLEKQNFQDKIFQFEEKLKKTPESKPADPASSTAHVPPQPDGSGEMPTEVGSGTSTSAISPAAPTLPTNSTADSLQGATNSLSTDTGTSGSWWCSDRCYWQ